MGRPVSRWPQSCRQAAALPVGVYVALGGVGLGCQIEVEGCSGVLQSRALLLLGCIGWVGLPSVLSVVWRGGCGSAMFVLI
jgi:hypothetical protein